MEIIDNVVNKVYKTKDYSKFKFIKGNRKINERNHLKLLKSMTEELLRIPIIVNKDYFIIDGQHRFICMQELELEVEYIIVENYGISQVKRANLVSTTWNKSDYLNMYTTNKNEHYLNFDRLMKEYSLNISDLLKMFAKYQRKSKAQLAYEFDSGSFKSECLLEVEMVLMDLKMFSFFKNYKSQSFVGAYLKLIEHSNYDKEKMREKLKLKGYLLEQAGVVKMHDYISILCNNIYSFSSHQNNIYFDKNTKKFYT